MSKFTKEIHPLFFVFSRMMLATHGVAFIQSDMHAGQVFIVEELPRPAAPLLYVRSPGGFHFLRNQLDPVGDFRRVHLVAFHHRIDDAVAEGFPAERWRDVVIVGNFAEGEVTPVRPLL